MKQLLALALIATLAACGSSANRSSASSDPCDASGIAGAIDNESGSNDAPKTKGDRLDDMVANIVQCEAASGTASTDPHDPLNLQFARANLAAGKAYALAGDASDARQHLSTAVFTAKFVGNAQVESEANAALKALH
ncbi:MAG: hypothetical protein M3R30_03050 [Candidatus Eremiobacteraeota bacterium]|nr:hypothetical protein [Candidatus Eremiobacteraeota bacterium]